MQLTEDIATLTKEVENIDASVAEATKMRLEEKASNKETVEDAVAAQKAVAAATAVLKDFYEKASIATGLLQLDGSRPRMGSEEWKSLANPNYVAADSPEEGGAGFGQGSEDKVDKGHKAGMQTFGDNYKGNQ